MSHIRRQTVVTFGFSTERGDGQVSRGDLRLLRRKIELMAPFVVIGFTRISQRTFERGTDIVTFCIEFRGHVTKDTAVRILNRVRNSEPKSAYVFSNVTILPPGANPNIHHHQARYL